MTKLSLCMITKNEEKHLENCLNSVKGLVDEIIIVDTGSLDETKEIAKRFNAKVIDFRWDGDFSNARNESLKHANNDWILVLDADEALDEEGKKQIEKLVKQDKDGFILIQKNYSNNDKLTGFINHSGTKNKISYKGWYASLIVRLFRNKKFQFKGTVHELVEPLKEGTKIAPSGTIIHHFGNMDTETIKKKREFYLDLCKNKVLQNPNSNSYYELGILYKETGDEKKAIDALKKSIELDPKNNMALFDLGVIDQNNGNFDEAINYLEKCVEIKKSGSVLHSLGVCYMKKGMLAEAHKVVAKALMINPKKYSFYNTFAAILEKTGNFKDAISALTIGINLNPNNPTAHYNLGVIYDKMNDTSNAIKHYTKAVQLDHKDKEKIKKRIIDLENSDPSTSSFSFSFGLGD